MAVRSTMSNLKLIIETALISLALWNFCPRLEFLHLPIVKEAALSRYLTRVGYERHPKIDLRLSGSCRLSIGEPVV